MRFLVRFFEKHHNHQIMDSIAPSQTITISFVSNRLPHMKMSKLSGAIQTEHVSHATAS